MTDDDFVRARTALRSFMSEMNHWEKDFYKQKRSALERGLDVSEVDDCARKALSGIFERWTLQGKANQGRLIDLGCSDPPTYDPETDVEDGVESTGGEVVFIIRQTVGMLAIFRITMKNDAGEWRVRKRNLSILRTSGSDQCCSERYPICCSGSVSFKPARLPRCGRIG
ncbi:NTF2 fold immunity protein [Burkholderia cepacia]|uniref:NTF2 fold immunity protein n=1 Tax=Burkholderia cepacia TaxID=292 RepID=UPI00299037C3|nr:NTF2 fold immunity protein [Burkholderia cepacia]